ncbi:hypothetical protein COBT_003620, partial [Conglomerata obtusa]
MHNIQIDQETVEIIRKLHVKTNNVPLHYYEAFYSESDSYIADLPKIGRIIISLKQEKQFHCILIRSIHGFKEYKFCANLISRKLL